MKQTAVEWLVSQLNKKGFAQVVTDEEIEQAKEMEINSKLKNQLFIGKVSEIIGFDKTVELLKECETAFKQQEQ